MTARRFRRTVLIALAVVPVVTGATLLVAQAITAISGYQPIDFTSWLMALVCVAGLISSLATPGHKRRAPRPRTSGAPDRRAHYLPVERRAALRGRPASAPPVA